MHKTRATYRRIPRKNYSETWSRGATKACRLWRLFANSCGHRRENNQARSTARSGQFAFSQRGRALLQYSKAAITNSSRQPTTIISAVYAKWKRRWIACKKTLTAFGCLQPAFSFYPQEQSFDPAGLVRQAKANRPTVCAFKRGFIRKRTHAFQSPQKRFQQPKIARFL